MQVVHKGITQRTRNVCMTCATCGNHCAKVANIIVDPQLVLLPPPEAATSPLPPCYEDERGRGDRFQC